MILLVDDDVMVRLLATEALVAAGFEVMEAADGEQALALFDNYAFSLVLLDVSLGGLDGFEVCRRIRENPRGGSVPVIMLTGMDDTDSIDSAYSLGATDFVTKPLNWTLLVYRVRYALRSSATLADLETSERRLAVAQRVARLGGWIWYVEEDRCERSPICLELWGDVSPSAQSVPFGLLSRVMSPERQHLREAMERAREGEPYQMSFRVQRSDGNAVTLYEQALPVRDEFGRVVRIEGVTQDVTEREQAERRMRFLAYHDSLTGLANRQMFREMLDHTIARSGRSGKRCALLYLDLDRLKRINDSFGHTLGDQILREVASRLTSSLRSADVIAREESAHEEVVARLGGDEFTVLLTELARPDDAARVAARICAELSRPLQVAHIELVVTASVGIAIFPDNGGDPETLLRHADMAMYAAKQRGRNTYEFFTEAMQLQAVERLSLEQDLARALESGQFELHYQPQVDAASGRIVSAEALLRWLHPERGMVSPVQFIPVAEETGLIGPLGEWVVLDACRHIAKWLADGVPAVPVAVNLSAHNFRSDSLLTSIAHALESTGIPPQYLHIELTESAIMQEPEEAKLTLEALKAMGLKLSIDDFGTGYSSLSTLKQYPIDLLKIDRSFVRDLPDDASSASIVEAILALARALDLGVVAEGVETAQQRDFLAGHDCGLMQGYLFSKPLPGPAFIELLYGQAPR
ncbi:putative bifunctional diguanylate cyclase/phosphodiesterase [Methyloversatilis thermotolerans]|uniref:putative bifunctional diguanylate cyclase/phosphodiesterase n=1 Tax=Methyloversatilis thermotolerans TaxID=1346290 RepID=UPI0003624F5E|nr:EAL domain-containing protein [Methyloversatilis thermotolerans]